MIDGAASKSDSERARSAIERVNTARWRMKEVGKEGRDDKWQMAEDSDKC